MQQYLARLPVHRHVLQALHLVVVLLVIQIMLQVVTLQTAILRLVEVAAAVVVEAVVIKPLPSRLYYALTSAVSKAF